jgi:Kef-type K+ transport system membrane component KefB
MSLDVMNLLLVLLAALSGGVVARRFGYPAILGELMAGIVLGPPLLGLLQPDDALAVIGKLGVVLLMLYIGLHLDPTDIGNAAKPASLAAAGGFIVPAGLGFGLMMMIDGDAVAATFVAVAMGVTSLATKSRILVDLGILDTRIAHVLMAGALFSDVAALIVFAAVLGLAATGAIAFGGIAAAAAQAALFLIGAWVVGTRVFPAVGRRLAARRTDPGIVFLLVVSAALAFGAAADAAGLHAILGAFLAGLFIRDGILTHDQTSAVEARARQVSVGLLAPVFFVTAGFKVSFDVFTEAPLLLAGIVVLATVGKIVGTAVFYLPTGYGFREGIAVGAGMNGRGAVEIIVAELALTAGLIDATVFSILVFMAIFTTATVPVLLTQAIEWLRRSGELVAEEREAVVIVGAGPVARRLAGFLGEGAPVTLIDSNADHCRAAAAAGLTVINGSGLDEDVLSDAAASHAALFVAATANAEVNVLAARLAVTRFGIPAVHAALPDTTTDSVMAMLREIGGELLFSRPVDIASWDADVDLGRVAELTYTVDDPEAVIEEGSVVDPERARLTSLPMIVRGAGGHRLFTAQGELGEDDVVVALGRSEHAGVALEPQVLGLE